MTAHLCLQVLGDYGEGEFALPFGELEFLLDRKAGR
jgi:hypothetical protein